jgi:CDP-6-deoxy-D-xylo-4-hexulose-3-dehydrase
VRQRFGWQLGELPAGYDHKYIYSTLGYNFKPTEMQAGLAVHRWTDCQHLSNRRAISGPTMRSRVRRSICRRRSARESFVVWFPITVREGISRVALIKWLEDANIETRLVFGGNILKQPGYRDIPRRVHGSLEQSDRIMRDTFFLGVFPGMTAEKIAFITARLSAFFDGHASVT